MSLANTLSATHTEQSNYSYKFSDIRNCLIWTYYKPANTSLLNQGERTKPSRSDPASVGADPPLLSCAGGGNPPESSRSRCHT